jgi:hypothetical protein
MGAFTANLEGTKVLDPQSFRSGRLGLSPELQQVEVVDRDLTVAKSIK